MGIRFACPLCARPLNIKSELGGRRGICPKCKGRIQIPREDDVHAVPTQTAAEHTQPSAVQETVMPARGKDRTAPAKPSRPPAPADHVPAGSPLDDLDALWYVRPPAGGQYGPASGEVMRSWIAENRITPSTLVWRQGWSQWRSAREALPGLLPAVSAEPAAAQPAAAAVGETPETTEPVILFGQAGIGQERNARSQRRLTLIILLAVTSLVLVGLLVFLALR
jgi:hypothetical protein